MLCSNNSKANVIMCLQILGKTDTCKKQLAFEISLAPGCLFITCQIKSFVTLPGPANIMSHTVLDIPHYQTSPFAILFMPINFCRETALSMAFVAPTYLAHLWLRSQVLKTTFDNQLVIKCHDRQLLDWEPVSILSVILQCINRPRAAYFTQPAKSQDESVTAKQTPRIIKENKAHASDQAV
jgi:hypothetical protein